MLMSHDVVTSAIGSSSGSGVIAASGADSAINAILPTTAPMEPTKRRGGSLVSAFSPSRAEPSQTSEGDEAN